MRLLSFICVLVPRNVKLSQYLTPHELARQTGQTQTTGLRGECGNVETLKQRRARAIIPTLYVQRGKRLIDLSSGRQIISDAQKGLHWGEIKTF